ncbi:MAG: glycosyltransferase [Verrucomicrobiota bacterium]|nr:glycosyltransferase [Verrucomicrobiota bacterium]
MTNDRLRLLYLTYAFPPGVSGRFPSLNPAGHATETRMAQALSQLAEVSTVGMIAREVFGRLEPRDDSLGLEHKLLLWDRRPELWHRWHSWRRLRRFYLVRMARDGAPDVLLVKNLGSIYNCFVRWLRRQYPRPLIVLILADARLGQKIPLAKRLRYAFKPMVTLDESKAILWFDACISFGIGTRRYFEPRGVPWMWMPSAFNFRYDPPPADPIQNEPIRFGYFGTLGAHSHVVCLVQAFLNAGVPGTLHACGHGGLSESLKQLAGRHPNFHFDGLLPKQSDCLPWAQKVDVLINPRPPVLGLENTFPSKIFEYAMTGKAILSTRTGGVDKVLGEEGLYLETENFEDSLRQKLREAAAMDRAELQRRGTAIRNRILREFTWDKQAHRMVEFLTRILNKRPELGVVGGGQCGQP